MSAKTIPIARFRLGRIVATPNALDHLTQDDMLVGITRHQAGDWGEVGAEDRQANDEALVQGARILSAYQAANGTKFWITTEGNRQSTTILLPEDY